MLGHYDCQWVVMETEQVYRCHRDRVPGKQYCSLHENLNALKLSHPKLTPTDPENVRRLRQGFIDEGKNNPNVPIPERSRIRSL